MQEDSLPAEPQGKPEIKCIQIEKAGVKLSLFLDDMVVFVVNLLPEISEFSKIVGYKDGIQKPVEFLYNSSE